MVTVVKNVTVHYTGSSWQNEPHSVVRYLQNVTWMLVCCVSARMERQFSSCFRRWSLPFSFCITLEVLLPVASTLPYISDCCPICCRLWFQCRLFGQCRWVLCLSLPLHGSVIFFLLQSVSSHVSHWTSSFSSTPTSFGRMLNPLFLLANTSANCNNYIKVTVVIILQQTSLLDLKSACICI